MKKADVSHKKSDQNNHKLDLILSDLEICYSSNLINSVRAAKNIELVAMEIDCFKMKFIAQGNLFPDLNIIPYKMLSLYYAASLQWAHIDFSVITTDEKFESETKRLICQIGLVMSFLDQSYHESPVFLTTLYKIYQLHVQVSLTRMLHLLPYERDEKKAYIFRCLSEIEALFNKILARAGSNLEILDILAFILLSYRDAQNQLELILGSCTDENRAGIIVEIRTRMTDFFDNGCDRLFVEPQGESIDDDYFYLAACQPNSRLGIEQIADMLVRKNNANQFEVLMQDSTSDVKEYDKLISILMRHRNSVYDLLIYFPTKRTIVFKALFIINQLLAFFSINNYHHNKEVLYLNNAGMYYYQMIHIFNQKNQEDVHDENSFHVLNIWPQDWLNAYLTALAKQPELNQENIEVLEKMAEIIFRAIDLDIIYPEIFIILSNALKDLYFQSKCFQDKAIENDCLKELTVFREKILTFSKKAKVKCQLFYGTQKIEMPTETNTQLCWYQDVQPSLQTSVTNEAYKSSLVKNPLAKKFEDAMACASNYYQTGNGTDWNEAVKIFKKIIDNHIDEYFFVDNQMVDVRYLISYLEYIFLYLHSMTEKFLDKNAIPMLIEARMHEFVLIENVLLKIRKKITVENFLTYTPQAQMLTSVLFYALYMFCKYNDNLHIRLLLIKHGVDSVSSLFKKANQRIPREGEISLEYILEKVSSLKSGAELAKTQIDLLTRKRRLFECFQEAMGIIKKQKHSDIFLSVRFLKESHRFNEITENFEEAKEWCASPKEFSKIDRAIAQIRSEMPINEIAMIVKSQKKRTKKKKSPLIKQDNDTQEEKLPVEEQSALPSALEHHEPTINPEEQADGDKVKKKPKSKKKPARKKSQKKWATILEGRSLLAKKAEIEQRPSLVFSFDVEEICRQYNIDPKSVVRNKHNKRVIFSPVIVKKSSELEESSGHSSTLSSDDSGFFVTLEEAASGLLAPVLSDMPESTATQTLISEEVPGQSSDILSSEPSAFDVTQNSTLQISSFSFFHDKQTCFVQQMMEIMNAASDAAYVLCIKQPSDGQRLEAKSRLHYAGKMYNQIVTQIYFSPELVVVANQLLILAMKLDIELSLIIYQNPLVTIANPVIKLGGRFSKAGDGYFAANMTDVDNDIEVRMKNYTKAYFYYNTAVGCFSYGQSRQQDALFCSLYETMTKRLLFCYGMIYDPDKLYFRQEQLSNQCRVAI